MPNALEWAVEMQGLSLLPNYVVALALLANGLLMVMCIPRRCAAMQVDAVVPAKEIQVFSSASVVYQRQITKAADDIGAASAQGVLHTDPGIVRASPKRGFWLRLCCMQSVIKECCCVFQFW